jgi:hypothetical protein
MRHFSLVIVEQTRDLLGDLSAPRAVARHWLGVVCPQLDVNTTKQTTMKKIISLVQCGIVLSFAQLTAVGESADSRLTIGAEAGTTGIGGSASWRLSERFGVRVGANYMPIDLKRFNLTTKPTGGATSDQDYDGELRLLSAPLALDFYPWADSPFRITAGVLVNQNRFTATVKNSGVGGSIFVFNGKDYLQSAVGDFDLEVEQQTLSPYVSIGTSFYFGSKKKWALTGELGVAYTGSPKASLTAPNRDPALDLTPNFSDDLAGEESKIEKDAEDYQFYPIVKIGVSFSF